MNTCTICGRLFAARSDAYACSGSCRAKARRRHQATVTSLLRRQTEAITNRDAETLSRVSREARTLLSGMA